MKHTNSKQIQLLLIGHSVIKNNFDVLRLLLAMVVIFSHSYVVYHGTSHDIEPYMKINNNTSDFGSVAVNWFFIISGFLITGSIKNSASLKDYFVKRVLRILPGFTVAFLISIFLFGPLGSLKAVDIFDNIKNYFAHVAFKTNLIKLTTLQAPKVGAGFEGTPLPKLLNEPLWTIQFEFICYLFVPVLALLRVFRIKWIAILLFLVAFALMLFQKFGSFFQFDPYYKAPFFGDPYYLPRFFTYFLSGTCFYIYRHRMPRNSIIMVISLALVLFASFQGKMLHIVMPTAGSYILFYIAFHPLINYSKFASKGDFSYGVYLYAWPIQQLLMYYLSDHIEPLTLFGMATLITLAMAFLSWHLVEKRFLQLKNKYSKSSQNSKAW